MSKMQRFIIFLEDMISGLFLVTGLGLVFYGVIMRYFVNKPVFWIDEVATYFVIWGALLGLGVALREGRHITVVVLFDALPLKVRRILSILVNTMGLVFCVFFAYAGILLEKTYLMLGQASLNSQTPLWIPYLIIPLSGALFGLRFLGQLYFLFKDKGREWIIQEERRRSNVDGIAL